MTDNRNDNFDQAGTAGGVQTHGASASPGLGSSPGDDSTRASAAEVAVLSKDDESDGAESDDADGADSTGTA